MDSAIIRYLILLAWLASPALSETRQVPDEYPTIQAAIDAALDGDVVLIAPGAYSGDGNRDIDFKGKAITVRSQEGPETCTIDCQGWFYYDWQGHHFYENYHRGFYFQSGEDANSVLQGFTITNGCVTDDGGAIYCYYSSPRIVECIVVNNTARNQGGGIAASFSDVKITGCIITNNIASSYPWNWYDLTGAHSGGGMAISGSHSMVTNCLITGNRASTRGGGIFCEGDPVLANCTICENRTGKYSCGGGVAFVGIYGYNAVLHNCILWGNTASMCEQISCNTAHGILVVS
jgi:predicted outer membrane repeat protein